MINYFYTPNFPDEIEYRALKLYEIGINNDDINFIVHLRRREENLGLT